MYAGRGWSRVMSVLVAAGVVASLVGCGADTAPATGTDHSSVTIDHGMGSTAIDEVPQRVVALSASWADGLLALGVPPVGVGSLTGVGPGAGKFPWQGEYDPHVIALSLIGAPDYEAIAALHPDLILADYSANTPAVYQRLSDIAPTIAQLHAGDFVSPWREQIRVLGRVLGREDRAEELVAENDAAIASVREALPGLAGKTFTIATASGASAGLVGSESDAAAVLLSELGLRLDPAVVDLARGQRRLTVSYEQARAALMADVLLVRASGAGESLDAVIPGWQTLPAVRSGAATLVSGPLVGAISDPSVLNIEFLLDSLRPTLEKAAGA